MKQILDSVVLAALVVSLGACGSAGDDGGGGNVGFGGAQDIGQFRDILLRGDIPGPTTFDGGGFFAEHYSELPAADCDQPLCAHAMLAVGTDWVDRGYQSVLQIGMNTPIDPATLVRKPLDLVLVVDVSGSMVEDNRIGYVRQGLHLLVDQLVDGDRVALVTYSDGARVLSPLGPLDRPALHARIDGLRAAGATNLYDGLDLGFRQLGERDFTRQARVMLLSDGVATAGVIDDGSIIALAEGYLADAVGLTTVGVGDDFNVGLMRGLAERGAGNFYYLESPAAVGEVFGEELDYFVEPLALDVDLEVAATPSYQLGEVSGTRLWQTGGAGGTIHLPAVFVASRTDDGPGESGRRGAGGSLFVDMTPVAGATGEAANRVAELTLRYRLPGADEVRSQQILVDNPLLPGELPGDPDEVYLSHEAMAEHYAMYNVYRGLRAATVEAEDDHGCALRTLERLAASTRTWNLEAADPDLAADLVLIDRFIGNLEAHGAIAARDDATCDGGDDGYGDYPQACSAGGGTGGPLALVLVALAAAFSRRRRRAAPASIAGLALLLGSFGCHDDDGGGDDTGSGLSGCFPPVCEMYGEPPVPECSFELCAAGTLPEQCGGMFIECFEDCVVSRPCYQDAALPDAALADATEAIPDAAAD